MMTNFYMTTFRGVKQHSYAACDAALAASWLLLCKNHFLAVVFSSLKIVIIIVFLPYSSQQEMLPNANNPLVVFVNSKSGGGQGSKLIRRFKRILNPFQVADLSEGGPLPA